MKRFFIFAVLFVGLSSVANAQIRVAGSGGVEIGNNVAVSGSVDVSGGISGVLIGDAADGAAAQNGGETAHDKLSGLSAVAYYKGAAADSPGGQGRQLGAVEAQALSKTHYALSAERLEAVYPDLVYMRPDGTKGINYVELVPLLVQAVGELSAKVAALEGAVGQTRSLSSRSGNGGIGSVKRAWLGQNAPNPFGSSADVRLSVPSDAKSATLCVYDMTGKQLRQISVSDRGETVVSLSADGLSAGMYLYSLIVDGSLIDTRRMVVAE